jgi:hypothetical protein
VYLAIAWVLFPGSSRSGEKATKIVSLMHVCVEEDTCVRVWSMTKRPRKWSL